MAEPNAAEVVAQRLAEEQRRHIEVEQRVHDLKHEGGLAALRELLKRQQEVINAMWPLAEGNQIYRLQGEAERIRQILSIIELGPDFLRQQKRWQAGQQPQEQPNADA